MGDLQTTLDVLFKLTAIIGIVVVTSMIIYIALAIKMVVSKAEQTAELVNRGVTDSQRLGSMFLNGLRYRLELNAVGGALKTLRSIIRR
jgi:hypothetical protein